MLRQAPAPPSPRVLPSSGGSLAARPSEPPIGSPGPPRPPQALPPNGSLADSRADPNVSRETPNRQPPAARTPRPPAARIPRPFSVRPVSRRMFHVKHPAANRPPPAPRVPRTPDPAPNAGMANGTRVPRPRALPPNGSLADSRVAPSVSRETSGSSSARFRTSAPRALVLCPRSVSRETPEGGQGKRVSGAMPRSVSRETSEFLCARFPPGIQGARAKGSS